MLFAADPSAAAGTSGGGQADASLGDSSAALTRTAAKYVGGLLRSKVSMARPLSEQLAEIGETYFLVHVCPHPPAEKQFITLARKLDPLHECEAHPPAERPLTEMRTDLQAIPSSSLWPKTLPQLAWSNRWRKPCRRLQVCPHPPAE